jgi:HAD superfamily hydrolase (TIGR01509 family)
MALQAIILDFDGVIADSERLHLRAFQETLAATPVTLSRDAYYAHYLGFDDHGVFRQVSADQGRPFDTATVDRLVADKGRRYEALTAAGEMLYPGVASFVKTAAARVPLAVASGAQTHEVDDVLVRAGLREHFAAVVGADQTAASKPAPDPYLEAFARLGRATGRTMSVRRTVAVEDSRRGLESARAAGLRTVAVTNTYAADALVGHAELVVEGLHALALDALDRLCEEP